MKPEQALQLLASLLQRAQYTASISEITQMGQQGDMALQILQDAIKPKTEEKKNGITKTKNL